MQHDIATLKEATAPIFKRYGVKRAFVYGSISRGESGENSDVDLLVSPGRPMGLLEFFEMNDALEDALQTKVDLATPQSLDPHVASRILTDLAPVYEG